MSDFASINATSSSLKKLLEQHITDNSDPQLATVPIELKSPKEMRSSQTNTGISLWLYRVTRNGDVLNQPVMRTVPDQLPRRPLPLDLHFLITPLANNPADEQVLLGRVMQVFNDHATLSGSDLTPELRAGGTEQLRLHFEMLSLEELTRVWNALQESYQLSVSYLVQFVNLGSDHDPSYGPPVLVREAQFAQVVTVE
jgi:Pvc16 N-terminal domain